LYGRTVERGLCAAVQELDDEVGLTQSHGWVDAWTSSPSVYAVAAETTDEVVAVNSACEQSADRREGRQPQLPGTSNAADSLLIWTRRMNEITCTRRSSAPAGRAVPMQAKKVGKIDGADLVSES
jgi:hypothetical protein